VKSILEGATTPERLLGHSLKLATACDTSSRGTPTQTDPLPARAPFGEFEACLKFKDGHFK
jgi:hypothetical protein